MCLKGSHHDTHGITQCCLHSLQLKINLLDRADFNSFLCKISIPISLLQMIHPLLYLFIQILVVFKSADLECILFPCIHHFNSDVNTLTGPHLAFTPSTPSYRHERSSLPASSADSKRRDFSRKSKRAPEDGKKTGDNSGYCEWEGGREIGLH